MCNIGKFKQIITNEAKPTTALEAILTSVPIKVREFVYARRLQRMEDKKHKR